MLQLNFSIHPMNLVYPVLEFQPERNLLVEGLLCLFELFQQYLLLVQQILVFLF